MNHHDFQIVILVWTAIALIVHVIMFYVTAPFGRHTTEKWGPTIDNKLGWVVMEAPSLLIMAGFLVWGSNSKTPWIWVLFALWIFHYFNRVVVYPARIRPTPKRMPLVIAVSAIFFNVMNAGLNGYYLAELAPTQQYDRQWLMQPHFIIGMVLFIVGMYINWRSDTILINLRKPGETGYKIPHGFLFDYVASPNLFGEIIEWGGFALMAWTLPALSFFVWTMANLVPRAKNHYDWYHRHFEDFPKGRKVVFPFLW